MIVTSVQIKTVKMQKHLYCPVFTKENPQKCGFFLCLCGLSGFLRFALIAYFLRVSAFQGHRKTQENIVKSPS